MVQTHSDFDTLISESLGSFVFANLPETRDSWEEGASTERQTVGMSLGHFLE